VASRGLRRVGHLQQLWGPFRKKKTTVGSRRDFAHAGSGYVTVHTFGFGRDHDAHDRLEAPRGTFL
jgi:hypothetical protein